MARAPRKELNCIVLWSVCVTGALIILFAGDAKAQAGLQSSNPRWLGALAGKEIFSASNGQGSALWITDGSAAGTQLIHQFGMQGVQFSSSGLNLVQLGTAAFFVADDGVSGPELWKTDGTTGGTSQVADLFPGATGSHPVLRGVLGNNLIFSAVPDGSANRQMYAIDGTTAGIHVLSSFTGTDTGVLDGFLVTDDKFYFVAESASSAGAIWVSDGSTAGTRQVSNPFANQLSAAASGFGKPESLQRLGNLVLYASESLVWTIDIATDTVDAVTATSGVDGYGPPTLAYGNDLAAMNGFGLFLGGSGALTQGLPLSVWRSDGTAAGTSIVAAAGTVDVHQFPFLRKAGDRVVYVTSDSQNGRQLWGTDGTAANTVRLTDVPQSTDLVDPSIIAVATAAGVAYYAISDGGDSSAWSVWKSDGTVAGTSKLSGIPSFKGGSGTGLLADADANTVFFAASYADAKSGSNSQSLFKYEPATDLLTPLSTGLQIDSSYATFQYDSPLLYFANRNGTAGNEPWVSDGTVSGTHLVKDINPQPSDGGSTPPPPTSGGGGSTPDPSGGGGGAVGGLELLVLLALLGCRRRYSILEQRVQLFDRPDDVIQIPGGNRSFRPLPCGGQKIVPQPRHRHVEVSQQTVRRIDHHLPVLLIAHETCGDGRGTQPLRLNPEARGAIVD